MRIYCLFVCFVRFFNMERWVVLSPTLAAGLGIHISICCNIVFHQIKALDNTSC